MTEVNWGLAYLAVRDARATKASGGVWRVVQTSTANGFYLCVDHDGCPALALESDIPVGHIRLRNLEVTSLVKSEIISESWKDGRAFTSLQIRCTSHDTFVQQHFIDFSKEVLWPSFHSAGIEGTVGCIERLVALFARLERSGTRDIQGLWAELFLISVGESVNESVSAWHAEPQAVFDFAHEAIRIEVKSTRMSRRVHRFSQAQLCPAQGVNVIVASIRMEETAGGVSVVDLYDVICGRIADGYCRARFREVFLASIGNDSERARRLTFDTDVARDTVRFYDGRDVPKIPCKEWAGVEDISFASNLEELDPIDVPLGTWLQAIGAFVSGHLHGDDARPSDSFKD
jgi:hypothetical protein